MNDQATRRGGELGRRLAAAAVLIPPVVWVVWTGGVPFAVAASVVAGVAGFEFYRLAIGRPLTEVWLANAAVAALPLLPVVVPLTRWEWASALVLGVSIVGWSASALRGEVAQGSRTAAALVAGGLFCGTSLLCLVELRQLPDGRGWVACTLAAVIANDVGAYFGGRRFGRHRMAPRVSPGKSWEGFAFGALGSLAAAELLALLGRQSPWHAATVALLASVFGPLGDLSKSLLKRSRGVKDAGHLIPGHGGMLDRADSLLFTSAAVIAYVALFGR